MSLRDGQGLLSLCLEPGETFAKIVKTNHHGKTVEVCIAQLGAE